MGGKKIAWEGMFTVRDNFLLIPEFTKYLDFDDLPNSWQTFRHFYKNQMTHDELDSAKLAKVGCSINA